MILLSKLPRLADGPLPLRFTKGFKKVRASSRQRAPVRWGGARALRINTHDSGLTTVTGASLHDLSVTGTAMRSTCAGPESRLPSRLFPA